MANMRRRRMPSISSTRAGRSDHAGVADRAGQRRQPRGRRARTALRQLARRIGDVVLHGRRYCAARGDLAQPASGRGGIARVDGDRMAQAWPTLGWRRRRCCAAAGDDHRARRLHLHRYFACPRPRVLRPLVQQRPQRRQAVDETLGWHRPREVGSAGGWKLLEVEVSCRGVRCAAAGSTARARCRAMKAASATPHQCGRRRSTASRRSAVRRRRSHSRRRSRSLTSSAVTARRRSCPRKRASPPSRPARRTGTPEVPAGMRLAREEPGQQRPPARSRTAAPITIASAVPPSERAKTSGQRSQVLKAERATPAGAASSAGGVAAQPRAEAGSEHFGRRASRRRRQVQPRAAGQQPRRPRCSSAGSRARRRAVCARRAVTPLTVQGLRQPASGVDVDHAVVARRARRPARALLSSGGDAQRLGAARAVTGAPARPSVEQPRRWPGSGSGSSGHPS